MLRLLAMFLFLAMPATAQTVTGPVRVIDADTIDIGAEATVRLIAIDAPEDAQTCRDGARTFPCGRMATEAARALYEGRSATCLVQDRDRYGRYLAMCSVAGHDMNAQLVARGLARTYRGNPTYAPEQSKAKVAGLGLWAYEMQDPADWRAARRAARAVSAPKDDTCRVKGNISGSGRIYHLPGGRSYAATRIDPSRGERWFCSEQEARDAGWRAARG